MELVAKSAEQLGVKIDRRLRQLGMSQAELARRLSTTDDLVLQQSINRYVSGSSPRPDTAVRIAEALDIDLRYLCDESIDPADSPPKYRNGSIAFASDVDLMYEYARRYIKVAKEIATSISNSEGIDWLQIAEECFLSVAQNANKSALNSLGETEKSILGLHRPGGTFHKFNNVFALNIFLQTNHSRLGLNGFSEAAKVAPEAIRAQYREAFISSPMMGWVAIFHALSTEYFHLLSESDRVDIAEKCLHRIRKGQPPATDPSRPTFIDDLLAG